MSWSGASAERMRRQARRLRAMAKLCDLSDALTAGEIDFRRLHDPSVSRDEEDRVISEIEAL